MFDTSLVQIAPSVLVLLPVLIAIAQFVKSYEYVPSRWVPLFVVVLGTFSALVLTDLAPIQAAFQGLVVGLMAMGAFTGVRATFNG